MYGEKTQFLPIIKKVSGCNFKHVVENKLYYNCWDQNQSKTVQD